MVVCGQLALLAQCVLLCMYWSMARACRKILVYVAVLVIVHIVLCSSEECGNDRVKKVGDVHLPKWHRTYCHLCSPRKHVVDIGLCRCSHPAGSIVTVDISNWTRTSSPGIKGRPSCVSPAPSCTEHCTGDKSEALPSKPVGLDAEEGTPAAFLLHIGRYGGSGIAKAILEIVFGEIPGCRISRCKQARRC